MWLGIVLLIGGLCGHLCAAGAIGGYYVAYKDHIVGFVLLTAVAAVILLPLGRKFWRGRSDITVFLLGLVQALAGFLIYLNRYHV